MERAYEDCGWITVLPRSQYGTDISREYFRDALIWCIDLPLLQIHPHIPPCSMTTHLIGGLFPEIQCLLIDQGFGEYLIVFLQCLKFIRCGLGGIWDTNARPLHTPGNIIAE